MVCQGSNCPDCLADDGELAWRCRASSPAQVAAAKCPKATEENKDMPGKEQKHA
jgi:hypothetical protein